MGLCPSSPFERSSRRQDHASVRGQHTGCHTMPSDPEPAGQSKTRDLPKRSQHYFRPCQALVPATGPRRSKARSGLLLFQFFSYAATTSLLQRNAPASTHMRCRTVASLRASATFARFMPRRFATPIAQAFRAENLEARVSMICAAS